MEMELGLGLNLAVTTLSSCEARNSLEQQSSWTTLSHHRGKAPGDTSPRAGPSEYGRELFVKLATGQGHVNDLRKGSRFRAARADRYTGRDATAADHPREVGSWWWNGVLGGDAASGASVVLLRGRRRQKLPDGRVPCCALEMRELVEHGAFGCGVRNPPAHDRPGIVFPWFPGECLRCLAPRLVRHPSLPFRYVKRAKSAFLDIALSRVPHLPPTV
jgi:hypothetical protein